MLATTTIPLLLLRLLVLSLLPHIASPATAAEKQILLRFKSAVVSDPNGALATWSSSAAADPCRDFAGVTCGPTTAAVEKILLHSADLAGTLSPALAALPALQILSLFGNRFSGNIPPEFTAIHTLHKLNLSRNALSGEVPAFLGDLPGLRLLDLSGNNFSGEIPANLFKNCFRTRFVSFSRNALSGPIPTSIGNCANLAGFDFSFNRLSGEFPPEICRPTGMAYVSVKSNSLSGTIADKVSDCQSLEFLDLASNSFVGEAPLELLSLRNLSFFNASFNQFTGDFPRIGVCGEKVRYLDVSGNDLSGEIGPGIGNCRGLRLLSLESNRIGGIIPPEIGELKSLSVLRLGDNTITGTIPPEIGWMELLMFLDLHGLRLSGQIPPSIANCRFLLQMDASNNSLEGEIPETFYNMTYLKSLDLHRNLLNGSIPASLGNLTNLEFFDLSENSLTGPIPESLGNLTQLTHFNLSSNNLSGAIPPEQAITQFGPMAFSRNPGLCGPPLSTICSQVQIPGSAPSRRKTRLLSVSAIIAIVAAALILAGVCVITVVNIRARRKGRKGKEGMVEEEEILVSESTPPPSSGSNVIIGKLVLFSKSLPSKYEDWEAGTKALLDKDCLIGGGTSGTVYKATFEGGVTIAVKKLETLGMIRNQDEFEQEIGKLGSLRHPNLVAFQGYYWSSTMQLILSEFVPDGNLYQHLHGLGYSIGSSNGNGGGGGGGGGSGGRGELHWCRRFGIALGTARALAYLHHDCKPQVLHLNIKSTNILIDDKYEAKLSDYGLGKLHPMLSSYGLTKFHTSMGYVAPELASQSLRFSDKCDVYSFGVVLLEIVTGRKPVDSPGGAAVVVLCDHVKGLLENGRASDCFDRTLSGFAENELIQVLKLGLICTSDAPSRRPSMAEVVQFLESIKPTPGT